MPPRLSELLERIRPAGAPGAPTEGEQQREEVDRAREIADIASTLTVFEEEADSAVAAAADHAAELRRDAERQARQIRSGVADRIAASRTAAVQGYEQRIEAEQAQVTEQIATEIARLKARAEVRIPPLVDAAMQTIWSIVPAEPRPKSRP